MEQPECQGTIGDQLLRQEFSDFTNKHGIWNSAQALFINTEMLLNQACTWNRATSAYIGTHILHIVPSYCLPKVFQWQGDLTRPPTCPKPCQSSGRLALSLTIYFLMFSP